VEKVSIEKLQPFVNESKQERKDLMVVEDRVNFYSETN
jgi:hypothetical protein